MRTLEIFKIGSVDFTRFVETYAIRYEVMLSDKSGRTARGNAVVDIINRKTKLTVNFRPMDAAGMKAFLAAVEPYANIPVSYWDAKADALKTITIYTGTPEITAVLMGMDAGKRRYGAFSLPFIEM